MSVLYLPRLVSKKNELDTVFLATASNKPSQIRPKTIVQSVLYNVLLVVDKDKVPDDVPIGIPIDKNEAAIKHHFYEADGTTLLDNKEKVAARVSASFPVGYGSLLQTGKLNQATYDCVEQMDPSGYVSWQVENLAAHNPQPQVILTTDTAMQKYLPPIPSLVGYAIVPSPFIKSEDIDDADDGLEEDVDDLSKECLHSAQNMMLFRLLRRLAR